jgi:hypothetical protein
VYLGSATIVGAEESNNNIPATFNASENKSAGSDNQSISITVKNDGTESWTDDKASVISQSGSCTVQHGVTSGNDCPSLASAGGTSCTSQVSNTSDVYTLKHIGGSFGMGNNPAVLNQITTNTCTVMAGQCTNGSPACSTQSACTQKSYCTSGSCSDSSSCMRPQQFGGCGGTWVPECDGTWGPMYSYLVSGGAGVAPGGTGKFFVNAMTAPGAMNTYNETWQMQNAGALFGASFTKPITVGGGGVITVTSVNAQNTSIPVSARWDITGNVPGGFVCASADGSTSWGQVPCYGTAQTYSGLPSNNDTYGIPNAITTTTGTGHYTLRSIERMPIAQKKSDGIFGLLKLSMNNIFSTPAEAFTVSPAPVVTLTPTRPAAAIVILWTPTSDIQVGPSSISLSLLGATSQVVTVTNSGAPASTLNWTATPSTSSGGNWLKIDTSSGSITNSALSGATNNVTVSFDSSVVSGLGNGTYNGMVKFAGTDPDLNDPTPTKGPKTVSVTLTVARMVVACSPSTIYTNGASTCGATVGGVPYTTVTWSTNNGTVDANGNYTAPATAGTAIVTAKSTQDPTQSAQATITIVVPPCTSGSCQAVCDNPTLTAIPSTIVVPEPSTLKYGCKHVTSCQLSQGGTLLQSTTADGFGNVSSSYSVAPSVTTAYSLTCVNSNYSSDSATAVVNVGVGNSGVCETNPNGAGCPGQ